MSAYHDYPATPGYQDTDTSEAAAMAIREDAPIIRAQCLATLTEPLTADEIASRLRLSRLSVRPRITELNQMDLIMDSGLRRKNRSGRNAIVWTLIQH